MNWDKEILSKIDFENIKNKEEKEKIAKKIADNIKDGDVIGFGSGSTSYLLSASINISTFALLLSISTSKQMLLSSTIKSLGKNCNILDLSCTKYSSFFI